MSGEGGEKPQPKIHIKHGLNQTRADQVLQTPHPYQGPSVIDTAQNIFDHIESLKKIIERLKNEKKINSRTQLPNEEALNEFINIFDNKPGSIIATYIDLKGFGEINRTVGHNAANKKIYEFGNFFQEKIRENDLLFHLHGDEFVLLSTYRIDPKEPNNPQEGLKNHLESINGESEVKFDFVSVIYDKSKHKSLIDTVKEADKILMAKKEAAREARKTTPNSS